MPAQVHTVIPAKKNKQKKPPDVPTIKKHKKFVYSLNCSNNFCCVKLENIAK